VDGEDEQEVVQRLETLFHDNFNEEPG
jgi:phosphotransferase system HPr-like phosphotransfer protein